MNKKPLDYEKVYANYPGILRLYREGYMFMSISDDPDFRQGVREILDGFDRFGETLDTLAPETVGIMVEGAADALKFFRAAMLTGYQFNDNELKN